MEIKTVASCGAHTVVCMLKTPFYTEKCIERRNSPGGGSLSSFLSPKHMSLIGNINDDDDNSLSEDA